MDQAVCIPAKPDIPAQTEMSPGRVCPLDYGVEMTLTAEILNHQHLAHHVLNTRY